MLIRTRSPGAIRRLHAVAALRGTTLSQLARRCEISDSHLRGIIAGERQPSARVVQALKSELGDANWAFVRGQTDTLQMSVTTTGRDDTATVTSQPPQGSDQ